MKSGEILQLTGIRFIASLMVCIFHFNPFTVSLFGERVHGFFSEMHVGVTFFFVLSGFLITYRYYHEEHINLKHFYQNRIARIFPVYILLTIAYYALLAAEHPQWLQSFPFYKELLLNLSLLKGFSSDYKFSGLLQAWSLTVEETFYVMAPLIFLLVKRSKLFLLLLPILFFIAGFALSQTIGRAGWNKAGWLGDAELITSYTFFGRSFEFFCGIALALLYCRRRKIGASVSKGFRYTASGIVLSVVLVFAISLYASPECPHGIQHPSGMLINNLLLPIAVALFYFGLIEEQTTFVRILSHPVLNLLGKSSYVFYLIHLWVGSYNGNILFVLAVSIPLSVMLYRFVEEPARKAITARFSGDRK